MDEKKVEEMLLEGVKTPFKEQDDTKVETNAKKPLEASSDAKEAPKEV